MTRDRLDEFGEPIARGRIEPTPLFDAVPSPLPDVPAPAQRHSATSVAAARAVRHQSETHRAILAILDRGAPLTDDEICNVMWAEGSRLSVNGIKPRRVELFHAGFVRAVDDEGMTIYGRHATRWGRTAIPFDGERLRGTKAN